LYIRYLNPTAVKVLGMFYDHDRMLQAVFEEDGQRVGTYTFKGFCFDMANAGVLFHLE
jgi:uncharacterized protein YbcV (DUF1398 family)